MPLYVAFSAPDTISNYTLPASSLEWYQPPWEPGNVFSYPASEAQLTMMDPSYSVLADNVNTWFTDDSGLSVETTWTSGGAKAKSVGNNLTTDYDASVSVSGQFVVPALGGETQLGSFELGIKTSYEYTDITESLITQTVSLASSTGITVEKPSTFPQPTNYQYAIKPYILTHLRPNRTLDVRPQLTDITAYGTFQTAFLADPTEIFAGGWWKQAYTVAPDVALNHPVRWDLKNGTLGTMNCVGIDALSESAQCATLTDKYPDNPWLSRFHWMRGLFITHAEFNGKGPQLLSANAGDKLMLQARVYNYSLAPMDSRTVIHVRFYGQPWNETNNMPLNEESFLIGEDRLGPLPAFSSSGDLNWTLAKTTFDTSQHADEYLAFWVVVWMENSAGGLVAEIPSHGLTGIPGVLTSLGQVPIEDYSNNVGFYKQAFYVHTESSALPQASPPQALNKASAQVQTIARGSSKSPDFRLEKKPLPSNLVAPGKSIEIRAKLLAGQESDPAVTVVFFDGDPNNGGTAFDAETAPYLKARDEYEVSVPFESEACGDHQIFVVAGAGTTSEQTLKYDITVKCDSAKMKWLN